MNNDRNAEKIYKSEQRGPAPGPGKKAGDPVYSGEQRGPAPGAGYKSEYSAQEWVDLLKNKKQELTSKLEILKAHEKKITDDYNILIMKLNQGVGGPEVKNKMQKDIASLEELFDYTWKKMSAIGSKIYAIGEEIEKWSKIAKSANPFATQGQRMQTNLLTLNSSDMIEDSVKAPKEVYADDDEYKMTYGMYNSMWHGQTGYIAVGVTALLGIFAGYQIGKHFAKKD